jgi:hypothetical protein
MLRSSEHARKLREDPRTLRRSDDARKVPARSEAPSFIRAPIRRFGADRGHGERQGVERLVMWCNFVAVWAILGDLRPPDWLGSWSNH